MSLCSLSDARLSVGSSTISNGSGVETPVTERVRYSDLTEICHTTRETLLDMSFTALGRSATILHTLTMAVRHLAENKLPAKITSTGSAPKSAGGRRPQRMSVAADLSLSRGGDGAAGGF